MKKLLAAIMILAAGGAGVAIAQQDNAGQQAAPAQQQSSASNSSDAVSLDSLLEDARKGSQEQRAENQKREAEFLAAKNDQQKLLNQAAAEHKSLQDKGDALQKQYDQNEIKLAELEKLKDTRLGNLGELFGVVRQVAGDTAGVVQGSIISVQYPGREADLRKLGQSKDLPSIDELRKLWSALLEQMIKSGTVETFNTDVVLTNGEQENRPVVRVGDFTAVSNGSYLKLLPESGKLAVLAKQPPGNATSTAEDLQSAPAGQVVQFAVDPSRGAILDALVASIGTFSRERIAQGGPIGYTILVIGAIGFLLVVERLITLTLVNRKVRAQIKSNTPSPKNPLGRVLMVYEENKNVDVETLELKLDEAILKELPSLERFLSTLKLIAAVAPLLGLLGTVTGMIETFQSIVLFGTGDPKMMASGIATALVTTMEGLWIAIPTVLLHSFVASRSGNVVQVLEEQAAGIVALHAEQESGGRAGA
jgi:biopolymer transport protein ExbB